MKLLSLIFAMFMSSPLIPASGAAMFFNDYFLDKTMRIDYYHSGDSKAEAVTLDQIFKYGIWAGSKNSLIDNFNNGRYYVKIYDLASNKLIFSKGFDCYFGEYKTSSGAEKGIKRTYSESVLIPYPKNKINFVLERRNKENKMEELFSAEVDPNSIDVINENPSGN